MEKNEFKNAVLYGDEYLGILDVSVDAIGDYLTVVINGVEYLTVDANGTDIPTIENDDVNKFLTPYYEYVKRMNLADDPHDLVENDFRKFLAEVFETANKFTGMVA